MVFSSHSTILLLWAEIFFEQLLAVFFLHAIVCSIQWTLLVWIQQKWGLEVSCWIPNYNDHNHMGTPFPGLWCIHIAYVLHSKLISCCINGLNKPGEEIKQLRRSLMWTDAQNVLNVLSISFGLTMDGSKCIVPITVSLWRSWYMRGDG